jgi:hypothetical protein
MASQLDESLLKNQKQKAVNVVFSTLLTKVGKSQEVNMQQREVRKFQGRDKSAKNLNMSYNVVTTETELPDGRRYGGLTMAQKTNPSFSLAKVMPSSR